MFTTAALVLAAGASSARAQNVGTVRDNEFRSRWADYQVDRPQQNQGDTASEAAANSAGTTSTNKEQAGLLAAFGRSFDDLLRNGPLQVRANVASGWEFSDEDTLRVIKPNGTDNSFFGAPALGVFYNQELGPVTVSARYSVGYVYYFDHDYIASTENSGILSQTAGLDLDLDGKRTNFTSHASGSYGNGNDIESGEERNLLALGEDLNGTYQLTEFTQLGATGSVGYQRYTGGTVPDTDSTTDSGSVYGDYVITGKTRLRAEFDAGQQLQDTTGSNAPTSDRYFYQGVVSANYAPAPKLTFDAGLGYGFQSDYGRARPWAERVAPRLPHHRPIRAHAQDDGLVPFRLRGHRRGARPRAQRAVAVPPEHLGRALRLPEQQLFHLRDRPEPRHARRAHHRAAESSSAAWT